MFKFMILSYINIIRPTLVPFCDQNSIGVEFIHIFCCLHNMTRMTHHGTIRTHTNNITFLWKLMSISSLFYFCIGNLTAAYGLGVGPS